MNRFTGRPGRVVRIMTGACLLLIGLAASARAQAHEEPFRNGLEAFQNKNWQAAASMMREAIKVRPMESNERVRRGAERVFGGGTEYLPHYFLGASLFNLNDCVGAMAEWVTSEQHGAVKARPEFVKQIQSGNAECERRGVLPPSRFEQAAAAALQQITAANNLAKSVTGLGNANLAIWRAEASLREQYDRAQSELQTANNRYDAGRASHMQRDLADAGAAADRARGILVTVEANLRTAIDAQRSAQQIARDAGDAIKTAEDLQNTIEGRKVAFTPGMTAAFNEGRDALAKARSGLNDGTRSSNTATLSGARTSAVDASTRFRSVLEEIGKIDREAVDRLLGEAKTRAGDAYTLLEGAIATLDSRYAKRADALSLEQDAERQAAQQNAERARRALERARRADNLDAIAAATKSALEARDRLNVTIEAFGPLTLQEKGIELRLQQGADLFLRSEYQQAVAALGDTTSLQPDVPFRLHFHLFKAAALYQLSLKSRENEEALRAQALTEVQRAKEIDSAFQLDARAFSPRFISFYQGVTVAAPPPPPADAPAAPAPPDANAPAAR
jgi:hypothetical protein